ncbi:hypothetical protein [Amycolatopsis decaplanina]|uniref:ESX-1 secretion-associated protein n=1 Tax=Amycolatopsis decaplanina DSM 44594 TaxID=1284240 RepID=M2XMT1_9PSEU|nr:hypothetical protein [Amycolatopsis decaplanina]EME50465.1 hypothetical protein H074_38428 [Amycolatopsis decaplanina DSM 44594]
MGDGLNMYVDATGYQVKALTAIGEDAGVACQAVRADIDWLSGTLGGGPMGARFKTEYEASRVSLEQRVDTSRQRTGDLGVAGQLCVDNYVTADAHAEAELLRVRFG